MMRRLLREMLADLFEGARALEPRKPAFIRVMQKRDAGRSPDVELYSAFLAHGVPGLIRKERWDEVVLSLGAGELEDEEPSPVERAVAEGLLYQMTVLDREEREDEERNTEE